MSLISPTEGERTLLSYMINKSAPADLKLHLHILPTTNPTPTITLGDLTEAVADGSYASVTLTGATFTIATDVNNVTSAVYPQQTFTFNSIQNIYGYYVTDNSVTKIMWIERFLAVETTAPASTITVDLKVILQ